MRKLIEDKFDIYIILFSLALFLVVMFLPFKSKPFGDGDFHREAKNLSLYIKGEVGYEKVLITRAPAPVFFYSIPYTFVSKDSSDNTYWWAAFSFTGIITTLSILFIRKAGNLLFNKQIGLFTCILFFIFPLHAYYSMGIGAEQLGFFGSSIALFGWALIYNESKQVGTNNTLKKVWILVLGLTILILSRPNTLLILGMIGFVFAISFFVNNKFFKSFNKVLIISFVLVLTFGFSVLQLAKVISKGKSINTK